MFLGHDLEDGLEAEVVEVGAAAAGPVASPKAARGKWYIVFCYSRNYYLLTDRYLQLL